MNDKNKQILMVGGILGAAIFVVVAYFAFMNVLPEARKKQSKATELRADVEKKKKELAAVEARLSDPTQMRQMEERFLRISARLPPSQDPIDVFELFRGYFAGTDVSFTRLFPGTPTTAARYREYPFSVSGTARYHDFGQLVNLVESNPDRLMHVTGFKLTNNNRRPSIHPMEIGISTFTLVER